MQGKLRILIVDDSESDAVLLNYFISISGLNTSAVSVSTNLREALEAVGAQAFDVILLDLNLPDSFGLESLHQVRQASGQGMIIVLSGNEDAAVAMEAITHGAQDFIVKGRFKPEDLLRSVMYGLERKKREDHWRTRHEKLDIIMRKAAGDMIWEWEPKADTVSVSSGSADQEDQQQGPVRTEEWLLNVHPDDRARIRKEMHDTLSQGSQQWKSQFRSIGKDGATRRMLLRAFLVKDHQEKASHLLGLYTDLTDLT